MRQNAVFAKSGSTWSGMVGNLNGRVGYTHDGKPVHGPRGEFLGRVTYDNEGNPFWDELGGLGRYRDRQNETYEESLGTFGKKGVGDMWDWLLGPFAEREAAHQGAKPMAYTAEIVGRARKTMSDLSEIYNRIDAYSEPWRSQARKKLEQLLIRDVEGDYPYHFKYWFQKGEWNTYAERTLSISEKNAAYMLGQYLPTVDKMLRELVGASIEQQKKVAKQVEEKVGEKAPTQSAIHAAQEGRKGEMGFVEQNWPVLAVGTLATIGLVVALA